MNKRYSISLWLITTGTTLLLSCGIDKKNSTVFPATEHLIAEKIELNSLFKPAFISLKNSTLIFSAYNSPQMLHFYSLPKATFLYSLGQKGNGPNEFQLFPLFCKSQSLEVYIWGYTPTKIKRFSITESGELLFEKEINLSFYDSFNQMHIAQDSLLIYSAIPSEFSIKKYNLRSNAVEGKIEIKRDNHEESFFYSNRGFIAANDSIIVYSYLYKKQIDLYRINDLTLKQRITGNNDTNEITVGDFENNPNYYISVVAGKKYFYALYNGKNAANEKDYTIEVYDYNGNPIVKYSFDIPPSLFEIDEDSGFIYGYNANYDDYILRYRI